MPRRFRVGPRVQLEERRPPFSRGSSSHTDCSLSVVSLRGAESPAPGTQAPVPGASDLRGARELELEPLGCDVFEGGGKWCSFASAVKNVPEEGCDGECVGCVPPTSALVRQPFFPCNVALNTLTSLVCVRVRARLCAHEA